MNDFVIFFHPIANEEYQSSIAWYERQKTGLGEEFVKQVERILFQIHHNPLLYPVKQKQQREAVIPKFPFVISYRFLPSKKQIHILAIFHTSRNPDKKYRNPDSN